MNTQFSAVKSQQHQMQILMEHQHNENLYALDGARHALEEVKALRERVDHIESKI
jgi:hypothetical protein